MRSVRMGNDQVRDFLVPGDVILDFSAIPRAAMEVSDPLFYFEINLS